MNTRTTVIIVVLLLVAAGAVGWFWHKSTVTDSTGRDTLTVMVPSGTIVVKDSAEAQLFKRKYEASEAKRRMAVAYYEQVIMDLNAPDTSGVFELPAARLDTVLPRYVPVSRGDMRILWDTVHVEYQYYPVNGFVELEVRLAPTPAIIESVTVTRVVVEGGSIWNDAKYFLIGAGTVALIEKIGSIIDK